MCLMMSIFRSMTHVLKQVEVIVGYQSLRKCKSDLFLSEQNLKQCILSQFVKREKLEEKKLSVYRLDIGA